MKKISKKIYGGILVVMLLATIGAVLTSAHPGFFSDLTDEQKEELKELKLELRDEGASCEETKEAIREQLEEYGVGFPTREEILDKKIEQTEQKLEILYRVKELVEENPEITRDEIKEIISEEFDLEFPEYGDGIKHRYTNKCGRFGPRGI